MPPAVAVDNAHSWVVMHSRRPHLVPATVEVRRRHFSAQLYLQMTQPCAAQFLVNNFLRPHDTADIDWTQLPVQTCAALSEGIHAVAEGYTAFWIRHLLNHMIQKEHLVFSQLQEAV